MYQFVLRRSLFTYTRDLFMFIRVLCTPVFLCSQYALSVFLLSGVAGVNICIAADTAIAVNVKTVLAAGDGIGKGLWSLKG